jgi:spore coat protein U-like protein
MRVCKILGPALFVALIAYVPPRSIEAATVTTTFLVTANIDVNCLITATQLDFGPYQPHVANATVPLDGQSEITVTCTNGGNWVVGLDQGQFPSATVTTRQMAGPSGSSLQYALFSDAARSVNWGNTVGVDTVSGLGTGGPEILIVYGRVAAGQTSAIAGGYTDTITATITF